ncbi:hypothetical protein [Pseudomonas putida]
MTCLDTTLVDIYDVDYQYVNERFDLWRVGFQDYQGPERTSRLATLAREIYTYGKIFSLQLSARDHLYYVLAERGDDLRPRDSRLTCAHIDVAQVPGWAIANLLIKALPSQLPELAQGQAVRFEAEGLYYLVKQAPLKKSAVPQVIAVEVGMWPQKLQKNRRCIGISVRTFTPLQAFRDAQGELPKRIQRLPRYRLDALSQLLHKSIDGEYVKKGLSSRVRHRVPMLDISSQSSSDFQNCKLGIFSLFLDDLERAYGGALKISFTPLEVGERFKPRAADVTAFYQRVHALIQSYPLIIVDSAHSASACNALIEALRERGFDPQVRLSPETGAANLMLVPSADLYEANPDQDPYRIVKRGHPLAAVQCTTATTLIAPDGKVSRHVLDVLLKELVFKLEVKQQKQLFDDFPVPDGMWFVLPWRGQDDEESLEDEDQDAERPAARWLMFLQSQEGRLHIERVSLEAGLARLDALDGFLYRRLSSKYWQEANTPLIYWPESGDFLSFVDSGAVALLDHQTIKQHLQAMDKGRRMDIPASVLMEFRSLNPATDKAGDALQALLSRGQGRYGFSDIAAIPAKGSGRLLFAWLEDELGAPMKTSLQGKDGPLEAITGMSFNAARDLYMCGSIGSPQRRIENFARLYHIHRTLEQMPDEVFKLMQPVHVRHKGLSVYPLPFKYLREAAADMDLHDEVALPLS